MEDNENPSPLFEGIKEINEELEVYIKQE